MKFIAFLLAILVAPATQAHKTSKEPWTTIESRAPVYCQLLIQHFRSAAKTRNSASVDEDDLYHLATSVFACLVSDRGSQPR